jgi:NADP-dependent 3-hydroxy acid dehydrogenase YdfG
MDTLAGKVCVVTGASRGIGKSIALALSAENAKLCLVGRDKQRLDEVTQAAMPGSSQFTCFAADLTSSKSITELSRFVGNELGGVDILVNCAGVYSRGSLEETPVEELDRLYNSNVRAPFVLTQSLLPLLKERSGQIVFINSPQAIQPSAFVGFYAASQHALKAIAEVLRQEVNEAGVRVLAIYPGRTATPRMEVIFESEGREYHPEMLLQADDIASMVIESLKLPRTAEVTSIHIRPLKKSY